MNSLVSVIMPVYNGEKFIENSILSVLNQTYKNFELIIIDDKSKDNTINIVSRFFRIDSRIKFLKNTENLGVAETRNVGLKKAKGRWIAFLDSDDIWEKTKLEEQLNFMKMNNVSLSYTGYSIINEKGCFVKEISVPSSLNYRQALYGNQIACLTVMIDKSKILKFEMPKIRHEDYATWLNILKTGIVAKGLNKNLARYRKVGNSLSSNKIKTIGWTWKVLRKNQELPILFALYCCSLHYIRSFIKHYTR